MAFGIDKKKSSGATRSIDTNETVGDFATNVLADTGGDVMTNVARPFGLAPVIHAANAIPESPLQQDVNALVERGLMNVGRKMGPLGIGMANALNYATGIDLRDRAKAYNESVNPTRVPATSATTTVAAPAQATTPGATTPGAPAVAAPAEHPWTKFKSVEEGARSLSDADFKKFVDLNQDHPETKGMGYMEVGTPGTKSYRMERIYPSQNQNTGGGGGYGIGGGKDLSAGQLHAIAPVLAARHSDDLRRQHLDQLAVANQYAHQDRADKLAEKRVEDFQKHLIATSPSTPDDEKKPMVNIGLLRMMDRGMSPEHMPGYQVQGRTLWDQREKMIVDEMAKKNIKYNPDDITRVGTPTYNARMDLIRRYENALMGKK